MMRKANFFVRLRNLSEFIRSPFWFDVGCEKRSHAQERVLKITILGFASRFDMRAIMAM